MGKTSAGPARSSIARTLAIIVALIVALGIGYAVGAHSGGTSASAGALQHLNGPAMNHSAASIHHHGLAVTVPAGLPASALSADEVQQMLKAHNDLRAKYGQPPLTWNADLASYAQDWANQIAQMDALAHRPNNPYGENVFWGGLNDSKTGYSPQEAVDSWGSEVKDFNTTTNTCPDYNLCGHFTQVVWGTTTTLGCGKAKSAGNTGEYWVCNYDPAGNITNGNDNSVKPF